ncbi:MAG: DUF11 domain-containing protein [Proteobacteria bacterium]|nr:DUF11 domain-containing protein [Pseudomonadota bacterium]
MSALATCTATAGSAGANAPGDGGGGGGGGAGSTGGSGGTYGADNTTTPSTAGGGGGSCYRTSGVYVDAATIAAGAAGGTGAGSYVTGGSGTAGSVTITALPSLMLQKTWGANSLASDSISVSTTGGTKVASVSSSGSAAGGTTAGTRVYQKVGDAITLPVEAFTPAASSTKYTATLTCTNATSPPTNVAPPRTITLTAADTAVVCTYTNRPNPDLSITKSNGVTSVVPGSTTTYTIRVTNAGPGSVTGAILKDPIATGLTKTGAPACSATPGQCTAGTTPTNAQLEGAGGYALPTLAAGQFYEITVTCNVN